MADNNTISMKVFLRDGGAAEARRFTVDASAVTNYIFMKEKLQTVFPNLRNTVFKITWKDNDGDEITIASDEDIITALTEMSNSLKVLYITVVQHHSGPSITIEQGFPEVEGPLVICDVCETNISGNRYKCMQCPDYDLCASCEYKGHHGDHLVMRVPKNDTYLPRCARKFMNQLGRNLKKASHMASKDAYRAAKFAHKYGGSGRCGAEGEHCAQPQSCFDNNQQHGCPFTAGEGINLQDVHALGALAKQHFGPVLDALRNNTSSATDNTGNVDLYMDVIRNAADAFFGLSTSDNDPAPATEKKDSNGENSNKKDESTGNETPMDVEGPSNSKVNVPENEKRDPGWTFVASKTLPVDSTNGNNVQSPPTAPAFVYHENPKIAEGLVKLHEMGFSNEFGRLTHLLERYHGDVNAVLKCLLN